MVDPIEESCNFAKLLLVAREHDVAVPRPVVLQSLLTNRRSFVDHM